MVHSNLSATLLRDHHAHEQLEMQPQSHLRTMGVAVLECALRACMVLGLASGVERSAYMPTSFSF